MPASNTQSRASPSDWDQGSPGTTSRPRTSQSTRHGSRGGSRQSHGSAGDDSLSERLRKLEEREGHLRTSPDSYRDDGTAGGTGDDDDWSGGRSGADASGHTSGDGMDGRMSVDGGYEESERAPSPPKVLHKDEIPLECQGHVGTLFQYLHARNLNDGHIPSVRIPDTVIIGEGGRITNWYFTSVDGRIKRKNRVNLLVDNVYKAFTKKKNARDVVAQYTHNSFNEKMYPTSTIDYFNSEELYNFLHKKDKGEGVLQKFIPPKGSSNCVLKATWTPRLFMLEQRVNVNRMNDYKIDNLEKCVTYEGSEAHSTANARVSATTNANLQAQCNIIAKHLYRNKDTCLALKLLVLMFKVDKDNRLYLLWCPQMKISPEQYPKGYTEPKFGDGKGDVPDVPIMTVPIRGKSLSLKGSQKLQQTSRAVTYKCPSCTRVVSDTEQYEVSYKTVILSYMQSSRAAGVNLPSRPGTRPGTSAAPTSAGTSTRGGAGTTASTPRSVSPDHTEERSYTRDDGGTDAAADADKDGAAGSGHKHDNDSAVVPPTLLRVNPGLTEARYNRCLTDPNFIYTIVKVCESCCLVFNECVMMDMTEEAKRLRVATAKKKSRPQPREPRMARTPRQRTGVHKGGEGSTGEGGEGKTPRGTGTSSFKPRQRARPINPSVRRDAAERNARRRTRLEAREAAATTESEGDGTTGTTGAAGHGDTIKSSLDLVESFDAESHHKFIERQLDRVHGKMGANAGPDVRTPSSSQANTPAPTSHEGIDQSALDSAIFGDMSALEVAVLKEAVGTV
eukprot:TRINITY_DN13627_c0_g1_i1.p1 TRINITY_DN13627_c0_g1~~TRINITY_DN13627_c0_g1_i1.p1  ORF type:complete len:788 (+),score=186.29 TRINITY_DN13627_c0_g1_i1:361-2724(+)